MSTSTGSSRRVLEKGPSGWLAAPALVFFLLFAIIPLFGVLFLSFTKWDGLGEIKLDGLSSWTTVLTDPVTGNALWVTAKIMFFSFIVQAPISLLLGVFTSASQKYRAALAVLYFVPLLLSSAAVAIAYKALLDPNFGLGPGLGLPFLAQDWLGNSDLVLFVVVFVIAWQFVPFHTLIYQGGVRQIPASLYEAAQIDGAGRVQQFFAITLPQLKYTIITSSTLMVVGSLAYFDLVFVLTGGGPGYSTRLLPLHMYLTGFKANDMGAASALGVILVVIGLALALLLQRLGGKNRNASQLEGA
ncbi:MULTISPECIES: carbohydrate ABC transporter permease [Arthrobacter]|uniref:Raffinose/stachyose/melibiose transport system permease protein n=2 Tax=Arthrobacter TaxID=1663 RepID=A0AAW8DN14_9MICC|nr:MULTISPECIES: sugar ABC transporter permease [Arthrobacter]MCZ9881933.1 sugar ABC transporter permease [Arthrobacter sp. B2a2-09]MDP9907747.1 raffinose/stachyose/melibiose transport system permease protein [Arthrobacter bambusae]MDQ0131546.1 raffinose/stachyose/melibiose transport system permease protein [Arthrobacter bambusae]MDQ0182958.1 raffinose/stachyose/melibiose transport system permease protein [Arthrobacter bambusae]MDQ0239329.1 raffinose/stachyose/melibiose transport system permea